jgi:PTH1 family peptidyl-tRNA hydrolase
MTHEPQPDHIPEPRISKRKQRQRKPPDLDHDAHLDREIQELTSSAIALTIAPSMATATRLLVCSIGNPGPLLNTLHSAGHTVLASLATRLSYPIFQKSRPYGNGLISIGSEFTLWQSTSFMNVSGVGVAAAWRQFVKENKREGEEVALVVLHDELESKMGEVKVKKGAASAKGHNGLKSINEKLKGVEYMRIGVGIGRPESRDPQEVANYVLRKMSQGERVKIEGAVGRVEVELTRLSGR